jgi:hypothetical protein
MHKEIWQIILRIRPDTGIRRKNGVFIVVCTCGTKGPRRFTVLSSQEVDKKKDRNAGRYYCEDLPARLRLENLREKTNQELRFICACAH